LVKPQGQFVACGPFTSFSKLVPNIAARTQNADLGLVWSHLTLSAA
jgi:hypothetical protein